MEIGEELENRGHEREGQMTEGQVHVSDLIPNVIVVVLTLNQISTHVVSFKYVLFMSRQTRRPHRD